MARSSAKATISIATLITVLCLFLAASSTHALRRPTTYIVGDDLGWESSQYVPDLEQDWARGKTFYAGDILVFRYDRRLYNLVVVNRTGYENCKANEGSKEYKTGLEKIKLVYGGNYFIGTRNSGDCPYGMKLGINALAPKSS